jgi:SAM-dependent methyltransferase
VSSTGDGGASPQGGRARAAPPSNGGTLTPAVTYWDERYRRDGKIWGDGPSELARLAVARLSFAAGRGFDLLDVGCGYGRDSLYLAQELGCRVLGIDPSPVAVATARRGRRGDLDVEFEAADPATFATADPATFATARPPGDGGDAGGAARPDRYDVVYASNVYHLLPPAGRRAFAAAVTALTRPGGLFLLSTLSPRDPQHYAKGAPVAGEERSWIEHCYLHFCTADELEAEFADLELLDLEERSYEERHADGRLHHHTSWFMEARRQG